ncbi:DUF2794 domain-containing protein [Microvirga sp. SRT01]|jgi:hypothetical protein|uniref:DUF2794 domain-containing protein n=2 Tax=Sphingomonas longa TaxID=2778730 RepID=A0ABS2D505_9SPHN|nr:DUF2794 domain-containing protein [Microvirga sp. SRT01]MBM6575658.1 DUF2794 domain-containing protein [Sphingomonas sp. BT552]MBR7708705.1 DUF2794 domain-containing protein [Microvirga sp. SRT01]
MRIASVIAHDGRGLMGVVPFPSRKDAQVGFDRAELTRILDLYGRMVAAGHWRDYAIELGREAAVFSAFRRTAERPEIRVEKRPALRQRQGMWALVGEAGAVLKRGHDLGPVLAPVERRLMKLVEE